METMKSMKIIVLLSNKHININKPSHFISSTPGAWDALRECSIGIVAGFSIVPSTAVTPDPSEALTPVASVKALSFACVTILKIYM